MPAPVDYASPLLNVTQVTPNAFIQGQQAGQGILDAQAQGQKQQQNAVMFDQAQQDRVKQQQAAQAAAQQQAVVQRELVAASNSGDPAQIAALMVRHPQLSEQLRKGFDSLNEVQQQESVNEAARAHSLILSGDPAMAADGLIADAEAYEAAGRNDEAKRRRDLAQQIVNNPKAGLALTGSFLAAALGPDKYAESFSKIMEQPSQQATSEANAKKAKVEANNATDKILADIGYTKAQAQRLRDQTKMEAGRLNLDRDEFNAKTAAAVAKAQQGVVDLDTDVKKTIEADAAGATAAQTFARTGRTLADEILKESPTGGVAGGVRDAVTGALGVDTKAGELNQRYIEIRNGLIKSNRKPGEGPMTDPDFKVAAAAYPGDLASPDAKARTIKRLAAQNEVAAQVLSAAARYRALTGGPGGSTKAVEVDGIVIPPRTDLATFNNIMGANIRARQLKSRVTELKGKPWDEVEKILAEEGISGE